MYRKIRYQRLVPTIKFDTEDKFLSHPSIVNIKNLNFPLTSFKIQKIDTNIMLRYLNAIDLQKKVSGEIPAFILKDAKFELLNPLTECINFCIEEGLFPSELKNADVIPVYKKDNPSCKENYRPISLYQFFQKYLKRSSMTNLLNFSKISCHLFYAVSERNILHNMLFYDY